VLSKEDAKILNSLRTALEEMADGNAAKPAIEAEIARLLKKGSDILAKQAADEREASRALGEARSREL
jgi:hypothetical protein